MSILDTFIVVFDSDNSGLKKGSDEDEEAIKKTTSELNKQANAANNLKGGIQNLIKQYGALAVGLVSARAIIGGFINAINHADRIDELSKAIGVSAENLSIWGDAVKLAGGTAESFYSSIQSLAVNLSDFATRGTSRAAPFFKSLGIQMTDASGRARDLFEILPELADAFQGLSKQEGIGIGTKIGLDIGTIALLQQGRRAVDGILQKQKELGYVTTEDAEIAAKFNDTWDDTAHVFRNVYMSIGSTILPSIEKLLRGVQKFFSFLKENQNVVKGAMIVIGGAILAYVVPPLITAAAAAIALYAPFILIGAAIAAVAVGFGLLYDDFMAWTNGAGSLIGKVLGNFNDFKEKIVSTFKAVGDFFKNFFTQIWKDVKKIWDKIIFIFDKISNFIKKIKSFFSGDDASIEINSEVKKNIEIGQNAIKSASSNPFTSQTSNSIYNSSNNSSRNTNVKIGDVNIQTQASDPEQISRDISKNILNEINSAVYYADDGVIA